MMATCKRVFLSAKKPARSQVTVDPTGKTPPQVTCTETWQVVYDGYVLEYAVQGAVDASGNHLPVAGLVYAAGFCIRVNPVRSTESAFVWDVTVDYSTYTTTSGGGAVSNVTARQGSIARQETEAVDGLEKYYFNTCGDKLPHLPTAQLFDRTISVSWSASSLPGWAGTLLEGKINSVALTGTVCGLSIAAPTMVAKCIQQGITSVRTQTGGTVGSPTYTFLYNCEVAIQLRSFMYAGKEWGWTWSSQNLGKRGYSLINTYGGASAGTNYGTFTDLGVICSSNWTKGLTPRTDPTPMDAHSHDINDPNNSGDYTGTNKGILLPCDLSNGVGAFAGQGLPYSDYGTWPDGRFAPPMADLSVLFSGITD
jgi:hypothetical protein